MDRDLVVGIDSSTQSTKAVAWDRSGQAVAEGRAPLPLSAPRAGWVEQDPADWWRSTVTALRAVAGAVDPQRIAAIAVSNQRETVAFFGADGAPLCPAIVWLDTRAETVLQRFATDMGAERLHQITGKPVDITPVVYRLAWMRHHEPALLDRTAAILDVHGTLVRHLTGRAVASWTSADPFGVLDSRARDWSGEILAALSLRAAQFAPVAAPGTALGGVTEGAAAVTGLRAGTPVIAAGGDGQCAGLGVDAARPGVVYLNLGTAQITGAYSPGPAISRNWRTMTAPTGEGYFLEGCQRAGTYFIDWVVKTLSGGDALEASFERLGKAAAALPVGSEGVDVLPYLSGCMDPHWAPKARAAFLGLAPAHGQAHIFRASLEALVLEIARCVRAMDAGGLAPERIVAVGGGAQNPLWTGMVADATGLPVDLSASVEASALGAGITAAYAAGWFPDLATAAAAMSGVRARIVPDPAAAPAWAALAERHDRAWRAP